MRGRGAVVSGIGAALILLLITTYRLERPGAYYDELHQAPGAFAYVGRPTSLFSFIPIGGLPRASRLSPSFRKHDEDEK